MPSAVIAGWPFEYSSLQKGSSLFTTQVSSCKTASNILRLAVPTRLVVEEFTLRVKYILEKSLLNTAGPS
ncbi:MAG: hypothetical protein IPN25_13100 [Sphingobacteriales bacterium]|nr:hypothetical protein [Sphingobacteriales bacterium]